MRFDLQLIASWIDQESRVLDLGCGKGDLLAFLTETKEVQGAGIEIQEDKAAEAIGRGLSVVQGDLLEELEDFPDQRFDYAVLSQTLQQVYSPAEVIGQMLRVARRGIVSFPNFSHWRIRAQLLLTGRAPVTRELPYGWHDTPNIRVITLRDFRRFCREQDFHILKEAAIDTDYHESTGNFVTRLIGLRAKYGLFLLGR